MGLGSLGEGMPGPFDQPAVVEADESVPRESVLEGVFRIFEPQTLEVHPLGQRLEGEGFNQCFVVA